MTENERKRILSYFPFKSYRDNRDWAYRISGSVLMHVVHGIQGYILWLLQVHFAAFTEVSTLAYQYIL